jgi:hypothetical protein
MSGHVETLDRGLNASLGPPSWLDSPTFLGLTPDSIAGISDAPQDPSPSDRLSNYQSSGITPDLAPSNTFLDAHILPLSVNLNPPPNLSYPQVGLLRVMGL